MDVLVLDTGGGKHEREELERKLKEKNQMDLTPSGEGKGVCTRPPKKVGPLLEEGFDAKWQVWEGLGHKEMLYNTGRNIATPSHPSCRVANEVL